MLLDDLKKANMQALKDKDTKARAVYSVLISKCMSKQIELNPQGKTLTDGDVLQVINKTVKELEEESIAFKNAGRAEKSEEIDYQKSLLVSYLPKLMSDEEIITELNKLEDKSVKNVMMHFKANFQGKCDMKKVSELARNMQ